MSVRSNTLVVNAFNPAVRRQRGREAGRQGGREAERQRQVESEFQSIDRSSGQPRLHREILSQTPPSAKKKKKKKN
jgi:predicted transposase YdaD